MPSRSATPDQLLRLAQFLNGLDNLATEHGIRVGAGTDLVDLQALHKSADGDATVGGATFAVKLAIDEDPQPGLELGVAIRHGISWER